MKSKDSKSDDIKWMSRAIQLGNSARLIAPPNPWVGVVIVNQGTLVGEGFTSTPGCNHAEINALEIAGEKAANSTLYTTLEPCCHQGRTPPCTQAIIKAKIKRVVIALKDPDEKVSGKGIEELLKANIEVTTAILKQEAFTSLEPYLYQRIFKKPFVIAKAAISVDGRIAAADGSSKWISNAAARDDVHLLRLHSDAILIGTDTALKDEPNLTVRNIEATRQPLRVLFDRAGKVKSSPLFDQTIAKTLFFTSDQCEKHTLDRWHQAGVEVKIITSTNGKLDIQEALNILSEKGVLQLLVEGGGTLFGSFLEEHSINRLILYQAPLILGDKAKPLFGSSSITSLEGAPRLKLLNHRDLDGCMRLEYQFL